MTNNDLTFYDSGSMAAKWAVGISGCLFGVVVLFAGLSRMRYSLDGDDIFLAVFGAVVVLLSFYWLSYSTNPRLTFSNRELSLRKFWSIKKWRYEEVASISVKKELIKPPQGRVNRKPLQIEKICIGRKDGTQTSFVAPEFISNASLIQELEKRCSVRVDQVGSDEET